MEQRNESKISIIVAHDDKRGIGKENGLLWHISEDLKRFKALTTGHPIIMGRKTFESIGKPLPNRTNILVTRDSDYRAAGVVVTHSLDEALKEAEKSPGSDNVFIIGGGEIYRQALVRADKLYVTHVEGNFNADTFFPEYSQFKNKTFEQKGSEGPYIYKFLELEK